MRFAKSVRGLVLSIFVALGVFVSSQANAASEDTVNVRVSPLLLLLGGLYGNVDFRVGENWTLGPVFGIIHLKIGDTELGASELGVRGTYYFTGAFTDGWYIGPQVSAVSAKAKTSDPFGGDTSEAKVSGTVIEVVGGYHWFWDSFNLNLGLGVGSWSGPAQARVTNSDGSTQDVDVNIASGVGQVDFLLGWTF